MKFALLAAPLLLGLAACASTGPESQLGKQDKKPRRIAMDRTTDCAFVSTVQDFEALDDRYIVLYTIGRRDAYLAEITGACFDVRFQSTLATIDGDRNGQICGFGRDSIGYRRLGGFLENCPILGLQKLSNERRLELGIGVPTPRPKKDPKPKDEDPPAESK